MEIGKLKAELEKIKDHRRQWGNFRHKLSEIIIIGLCTIIVGGEDFGDMEEFGKTRREWLKGFLELPNGIPDADTFRRVFERLASTHLAERLNNALVENSENGGGTINIDGKTICGSSNPNHRAYHVVSAWVHEHEITLGQLATDEKSNEITAIPELLDTIDIAGDIVTIDAMGCQSKIADKILQKGADYVLAVKENQPSMHEAITDHFQWLDREGLPEDACETYRGKLEKNHGCRGFLLSGS